MRILLVLGLLFVTVIACSQDDRDVLVHGVFLENGGGEPVRKASIKLFQDKNAGQKLVVQHDSGYFSMKLDFDHVYYIEFSAKGRVTKSIQIDTRNVPNEEKEGGFGMNVDILMIKPNRKKHFRFLKKESVGRAKFDPEELVFTWDIDHAEMMQHKIQAALEADAILK